VWGASPNSPRPSDIGVLTKIVLSDRGVPLGVASVSYRAYAISRYSTAAIYSSPTIAVIAGMAINGWRLKNCTTLAYDVAGPIGKWNMSSDYANMIVAPDGRSYPIVQSSDQPNTQKISFDITVYTKANYDKLISSLNNKSTLFLQTNIEGIGYYFRPVDAYNIATRVRQPDSSVGTVGLFFTVTISGVIVKPYE